LTISEIMNTDYKAKAIERRKMAMEAENAKIAAVIKAKSAESIIRFNLLKFLGKKWPITQKLKERWRKIHEYKEPTKVKCCGRMKHVENELDHLA